MVEMDYQYIGTSNAGLTVGVHYSNNSELEHFFFNGSNTDMFFRSSNGNTERMRITSTGKVNIGDTQMSQNLLNIARWYCC